MEEIQQRIEVEERVLVTTLTKRMAEELDAYLRKYGVRCAYIHSDVDTIERVQIMDDLRKGVYHMGQNMPGVPRVTFRNLQPGTKVVMRFAEVKYPKLPAYAGNEEMIMLENIRSAMAQDIYIAKGGVETYQPRSTYHGYQPCRHSHVSS